MFRTLLRWNRIWWLNSILGNRERKQEKPFGLQRVFLLFRLWKNSREILRYDLTKVKKKSRVKKSKIPNLFFKTDEELKKNKKERE